MLLCLSSFSKEASLMAVKGAPSSSCNLISFNATTCFVKLKKEKYTHIKDLYILHDNLPSQKSLNFVSLKLNGVANLILIV